MTSLVFQVSKMGFFFFFSAVFYFEGKVYIYPPAEDVLTPQ